MAEHDLRRIPHRLFRRNTLGDPDRHVFLPRGENGATGEMKRSLHWRGPGSGKLTPEASVKSAIRDLCAAKRWLLVPVLARRDNRGQSLRGSPDYFVIARGRTIAVEVKRAKGGILSDDQLWFQSECHRLKAPHLVCTDALQLEAYNAL